MSKSYVAVYWATSDRPLLGGVTRSSSSRFGSRQDCEHYLQVVLSVNREASCPCEGLVEERNQVPEIFHHCPGFPAQSVNCKCFGCGKLLTFADASNKQKTKEER